MFRVVETRIVVVLDAEFPWVSTAVKVTVFSPRSLHEKVSGDTDNPTPPQLSDEPLSMSDTERTAVPSDPRTSSNGFTFTTGDIVSSTVI